ncbi:MAG: HD domain-containing phosphohydrolase [Chloroflexota bacterium]
MKLLDMPPLAVERENVQVLAGRPGLCYSADLDLRPFTGLFAELGMDPQRLNALAMLDITRPNIFLVSAGALLDRRLSAGIVQLQGDLSTVIVIGDRSEMAHASLALDLREIIFAWLDLPVSELELAVALRNSLRQIRLSERSRAVQLDLDRRAGQMADLHHVGVALSAERNVDALQTLILTKARDITDADAGSLYLVVEEDRQALDARGQPLHDGAGNAVLQKVKVLAFNKAQNFSNPTDFKAFRMPLNTGIAGYVATTGAVVQHEDIYQLSEGLPYSFNVSVDHQSGYRTKSMLTVPMINSEHQIIGVIQLINRKRRAETRLTAANVDQEVLAFSLENRDLALSFASQAAVALDNKRLIDSIQTLFEGFVTASVQAIESRDPTTSGHSGRVASLTVRLAEVVNETQAGPFKDLYLDPDALREIRYASLLHDFGKVGVREHVLVKAKKLYDWQIEQIRGRFGVAGASLEARYIRRKLDYLLEHGLAGSEEALAAIEREAQDELERLRASLQLVKQANEPTVLEGAAFEQLGSLASLTYLSPDAGEELLVGSAELKKLAIKKGSLDESERLEIESHVTHTYRFLTKIPWTGDLQRVPEIAWAHHEKLDGSGYPNRLTSEQIPLQSKMMTIADIYDALTAWDRPYKKAVPVDKALQILHWEVNDGHVDATLLDLFVQQEVYRVLQAG